MRTSLKSRFTSPGIVIRSAIPTHSCRDENQVRARQFLRHLIARFLDCPTTYLGICASTQTPGHVRPDLDATGCERQFENLCICVGRDEIDTLQTGIDHAVHGVATGPTHANHAHLGLIFTIHDRKCDHRNLRDEMPDGQRSKPRRSGEER